MIVVLLGACSYGVVGSIAKQAYQAGFTAPQLVGTQQLLAAPGLWAMALLFAKRRPSLREALLLLLAGTTTGVSGLRYYGSLQYLEASISLVMLFQFTWMGILSRRSSSGACRAARRCWPSCCWGWAPYWRQAC